MLAVHPFQFLDSGIERGLALAGSYDPALVTLSIVVAALAAFAVLGVAGRIAAAETTAARWSWLGAGAVVMGIGVWAMHFIGMLAFRLPVEVAYDVWITTASVLPSILASWIVMGVISRSVVSLPQLLVGGALMGVGIGAMHYTGMAAMRMNATMFYDPLLFAVSILVAVVLATVALYSNVRANHGVRKSQVHWTTVGAALVMGFAVSGMHYTGMAAAFFFPGGGSRTEGLAFDPTLLGIWVAIATLLITGLAIVVTLFDRRLEKAVASARVSHSRMLTAIESISEGFSLYGADDRLVLCNSRYRELLSADAAGVEPGMAFERVIRAAAESGLVYDAQGHTAEWIEERLAQHRDPSGPFLQRRTDGRWIQIDEQRAEGIGTVAIYTDITERKEAEQNLKRANQELEGTSSVILRWAPDGTVLHLNKFGLELFGFSAAEIVGKPLLGTIVPPSESRKRDIKRWIDDLQADPERLQESSEHQNQRKNGDLVWMAWRHRFIRNPDQSLKEILAIGIDITKRKEAELKLEAVSESAADAIVLGDTSDTVIGWNGAAETILGWSRDEIMGRSLQTLIPEGYRAAHRAGIERINQTGEGRVLGKTMELTALHREGHEVEIELSLSTWMVASDRFYTGIIRDITERKKMEAALQKSYDTVAAAHARMEKDLEAAARVQQSLLPASLPASDRVRIAWQYHPCDELAGDSLNVHSLGPRHVAFYIVDVSGHGVPAALLSVSVNRSLEPSADASSLVTGPGNAVASPAEVAQRLNTLYAMQGWDNHYFTMVYGVLDLETGRFRFITAGHPGPILVRPGAPPEQIEARSLFIGFLKGATFSDSEVQLAAGDRLYMFSDGLYEEMNDAGEQFEISRLMEALTSRVDEPLDASLEFVRQDLIAWHGEESFTDDFSILAVEMLGT